MSTPASSFPWRGQRPPPVGRPLPGMASSVPSPRRCRRSELSLAHDFTSMVAVALWDKPSHRHLGTRGVRIRGRVFVTELTNQSTKAEWLPARVSVLGCFLPTATYKVNYTNLSRCLISRLPRRARISSRSCCRRCAPSWRWTRHSSRLSPGAGLRTGRFPAGNPEANRSVTALHPLLGRHPSLSEGYRSFPAQGAGGSEI